MKEISAATRSLRVANYFEGQHQLLGTGMPTRSKMCDAVASFSPRSRMIIKAVSTT
jgi:hypothetical protein